MAKEIKNIPVDTETHKEISRFKKATGVSLTSAMERAWQFYKESKEYATLILFKREK